MENQQRNQPDQEELEAEKVVELYRALDKDGKVHLNAFVSGAEWEKAKDEQSAGIA